MDPHEKARVVESMEADFSARMDRERARLAERLNASIWAGICPVCGASCKPAGLLESGQLCCGEAAARRAVAEVEGPQMSLDWLTDRERTASEIGERREYAAGVVRRYATDRAPMVDGDTLNAICRALGEITLDEALMAVDRIHRERDVEARR